MIRSNDGSVDTIPHNKLVKAANNVPLATSIKSGKRGIVKVIRSYNKKRDTYSITNEMPDPHSGVCKANNSNVKDTIKAKNMREGHPTKLSTMECQYSLNVAKRPEDRSPCQNSIPDQIRKFI